MPAHAIGSATHLVRPRLGADQDLLHRRIFALPSPSTGSTRSAGRRLKQQYVCPKDGDKVEKDEMVKGYEFAKGQYVQFTPDELKTLDEKAHECDRRPGVRSAEEVDRIYLEKCYYLGPDKGGERAYRLLVRGLEARPVASPSGSTPRAASSTSFRSPARRRPRDGAAALRR